MKFKVVLQEAEEGGYIVSCPALLGCHSQGDNMEEALENIREAIKGCTQSLAEDRMELQASSLANVKERTCSFERKHGCNLETFEDRLKQLPENFERWDDFIEWKAYEGRLKNLE